MYRAIAALSFVLFISGCSTPPPRIAQTESGWPEVFIPNVSPDKVHDRIVERSLSGGATIDKDTPASVSISKLADPQTDRWMKATIGSFYGSDAKLDLTFYLVNQPSGGTKVFTRSSIWQQLPGGEIKRVDLNGNADFNSVQAGLYKLRDSFK